MAERTLPGLGLKGFWPEGTDHWGDDNDANLRRLSALVQCGVLDIVAAEPGSPADGDIYLLSATGNANKIAVRDDGAWVYFAPSAGWWIYDKTGENYLSYDGTGWAPFAGGGGGGGITEAPIDGTPYARQDAGWVPATGGGGGGGGVVISARYWALTGITRTAAHDGWGACLVEYRDSLGTALTGTGTPSASATNAGAGGYTIAGAFNGLSGTNDGWYSGDGNGDGTNARLIYDFGAPVTPATVEFAPLTPYTWSMPQLVEQAYSLDGIIWHTLGSYAPGAGVAHTAQSFDIPTAPGGGTATPWWYQPPLAAAFAFLDDGTPVTLTDDADEGLLFDCGAPVAGDKLRMAYQTIAAPTADWALKVRMNTAPSIEDYTTIGLVMYDTTSTKQLTFGWDNTGQFNVTKWNAGVGGNFSANAVSFSAGKFRGEWFKIAHVGTNYVFSVSSNGKNWRSVVTITDTAWGTHDRIGIGCKYTRTTGDNSLGGVQFWELTP